MKAVGAVVKAIQVDGADRPALCDEVDEYFRKNFRKIEFEDAKKIVLSLGFDYEDENKHIGTDKIQGLDDKFWVWETLEEATRPHIEEMS